VSPRRLVSTPKRLASFVVIAALAFPVGTFFFGRQVSDNCEGIHRLVLTLDTMIGNSTTQVRKYQQEGLLTRAQVRRALREQAENRRLLAGADCK
jgi:hypothetical protein